ncbi:MAG TPA: hypothetical protein VGC97_05485 [Pyrinomonadaceae bacterium]|jgi:hypothetical protein
MGKNLIDSVKDWLEKSGYPLELFVAKTLKKLDYFCSKSPLFIDLETKVSREIDIVASKFFNNDYGQYLTSKLIIECKKSSYPFVVLCNESVKKTLIENAFFGNIIVDRDGSFITWVFLIQLDKHHKINFKSLFPTKTLNLESRQGYSLVQAHTNSDSYIYTELYKLAKAYEYEVQKDLDFYKEMLENEKDKKEAENSYKFHIPILVIDAPLVETYIDNKGDVIVEEKEISNVKITLPWREFYDEGLVILLVTKQKFADLAQDILVFTKEIVERQRDIQKYLRELEKKES